LINIGIVYLVELPMFYARPYTKIMYKKCTLYILYLSEIVSLQTYSTIYL